MYCRHDRLFIGILLSIGVGGAMLTYTIALAQVPTAGPPPSREHAKDEPAPRPVVIQPPEPAAGEPTMKDLVEQAAEEHRPYVLSELHFLRKVCGLTNEQCKPIVLEAKRLLEEVAKTEAIREHDLAKKGRERSKPASEPGLPDPRERIRRGLTNIVKTRLTTQQSGRYQAEISQRTADRKQAAIRHLVARLDRRLILTAGQRDQIISSLMTIWIDAWGVAEVPNVGGIDDEDYEDELFPPIPDRFIMPLLSRAQKKAWAALKKIRPGDDVRGRLDLSDEMDAIRSDFADELGAANNQQGDRLEPPAIP
jgi:hypothetical protein